MVKIWARFKQVVSLGAVEVLQASSDCSIAYLFRILRDHCSSKLAIFEDK